MNEKYLDCFGHIFIISLPILCSETKNFMQTFLFPVPPQLCSNFHGNTECSLECFAYARYIQVEMTLMRCQCNVQQIFHVGKSHYYPLFVCCVDVASNDTQCISFHFNPLTILISIHLVIIEPMRYVTFSMKNAIFNC